MHMASALISPAVGAAMFAASAAANGYAVKNIKKEDICEKKVPVVGVMGAFVFAAQMVNFTIPGTGSSGHIAGGILLSAMIGNLPALLTMSIMLIVQCLLFADGGLLALGCNIFNMGVIPCLIVYPLVFKPFVKKGVSSGKLVLASVLAVVIGLQLGAFSVVMQTQLSGITELPFLAFLSLMQPVHLAIGIGEGVITAAVLCFVYKACPEIITGAASRTAIKAGVVMKNVLITLIAITLLTGGVLTMFASAYPDGLEWSVEKTAPYAEFETNNFVMQKAEQVQQVTAFMPGYTLEHAGVMGTSVAGITGSMITLLFTGGAMFMIFAAKKKSYN